MSIERPLKLPIIRKCEACKALPVILGLVSNGLRESQAVSWVVSCQNIGCPEQPQTVPTLDPEDAVEEWNGGN